MKRNAALILALALLIPLAMVACGGGGSGGGGSTNSEYTSTDTPINIPDDNISGIRSEINVSGIAGTISDVTVDVDISHTCVFDLSIDIESPEGTFVSLAWAEMGCDTGDDFDQTRFDDAASTGIWEATAPFSGSYIPEELLSAFNGEDPNGTWTLYVVDDLEYDTGSLRAWGLNID